MRRFIVGLYLSGVLLLLSCANNPYSPDNMVDDVDVSYVISKVNDTVNAYCFFPITLQALVAEGQEKYLDSLLYRMGPGEKFQRFNRDYMAQIEYASEGVHELVVRKYPVGSGGKYIDSVFNIRVDFGFSASPISVNLGDSGLVVDFRAVGYKADDIRWEWDLTRIGGPVLTCRGDTAYFIKREFNDTVFLRQVNNSGKKTGAVAIPFRSGFYEVLSVPFTVSRSPVSEYNSYCFFPMTFTASPRTEDRRYIDRIELFMKNNPSNATSMLFASNSYSVSLTYADTGLYHCVMRVYQTMKDVSFYKDTSFDVRVGLNYGGMPVDMLVEGEKTSVDLVAMGSKAEDVFWVWDLSRIGMPDVMSNDSIVSISVANEYDDLIFVAQMDSLGSRSPWVAVPFKSTFYRLGKVSYTLSRVSAAYNGYCFTPITLGVNYKQKDVEYIDSVEFLVENDMGMNVLKLSDSGVAVFDFAKSGNYTGRLLVYDSRLVVPEIIKVDISVGQRHSIVNGVNVKHDYTGQAVSLLAGGELEEGVKWRWKLPDGKIVDSETDLIVIDVPGVEVKKSDGLSLCMIKEDEFLGEKRIRVSDVVSGEYVVELHKYRVRARVVGPDGELSANDNFITECVLLVDGDTLAAGKDFFGEFEVKSGVDLHVYLKRDRDVGEDWLVENFWQIRNGFIENLNSGDRFISVMEDIDFIVFVRPKFSFKHKIFYPAGASPFAWWNKWLDYEVDRNSINWREKYWEYEGGISIMPWYTALTGEYNQYVGGPRSSDVVFGYDVFPTCEVCNARTYGLGGYVGIERPNSRCHSTVFVNPERWGFNDILIELNEKVVLDSIVIYVSPFNQQSRSVKVDWEYVGDLVHVLIADRLGELGQKDAPNPLVRYVSFYYRDKVKIDYSQWVKGLNFRSVFGSDGYSRGNFSFSYVSVDKVEPIAKPPSSCDVLRAALRGLGVSGVTDGLEVW